MAISDDPPGARHEARRSRSPTSGRSRPASTSSHRNELFTLFGAHVKASGVRAGVSFQRLFDDDPETEYWKSLIFVARPRHRAGRRRGARRIRMPTLRSSSIPARRRRPRSSSTTSATSSATPPSATSGRPTRRSSKPLARYGFPSTNSGSSPSPTVRATSPSAAAGRSSACPPRSPSARRGEEAGAGHPVQPAAVEDPGRGPPAPARRPRTLLPVGRVSIIGSGMISDRIEGPVRLRETAFAIDLSLSRQTITGGTQGNTVYSIGGQFLYGRATGGQEFTYVMAGVHVSPIPLSPGVSLVNLRGLFAWDMQPELGPADAAAAQPMRLFEWYKANAGGIEIPGTRNIAARRLGTQAERLGLRRRRRRTPRAPRKASASRASSSTSDTPAVRGFLAALEIYPRGKKPIAYGVVEVDGDHWSVLVGLAIGVQNATGKELPFFDDAVGLTGTFYATNQPATFAIGRLDDISSWLALRVKGDLWVFKLQLFIGACLEIVDVPDGTRVMAFRAEFSGGTKRCAIGSIEFSLSMQLSSGSGAANRGSRASSRWLEGIDPDQRPLRLPLRRELQDRMGVPRARPRLSAHRLRGQDPHAVVDARQDIPLEPHDRPSRTSSEMATASSPLLAAMAHPLASGDPITFPVSALSTEPDRTFSIAELTSTRHARRDRGVGSGPHRQPDRTSLQSHGRRPDHLGPEHAAGRQPPEQRRRRHHLRARRNRHPSPAPVTGRIPRPGQRFSIPLRAAPTTC